MTRRPSKLLRPLILASFLFAAMSAQAADNVVRVELNKLEPQGDACRAYLVLQNGTDSAFASLKLDLVIFDADGVVAKRLAVETAPLRTGKTSLKVFDMKGLVCKRVGRLLLNTVMKCADKSGARENCLDSIATAARGPVPFIK